jgi:type VI secretion system secreted protein Hcp
MSATFLLKIDGITGESQFDGFSDYMQVDKWRVGGTQTGTFGSGTSGGTGGTFSADDLDVTMQSNKGTPKMLEGCASGKHFKTATLVALKSVGDGKPMEYLKITLSDVVISKHSIGYEPPPPGSKGADLVVDNFSLDYAKIAVEYKEQKKDGSQGPGVEGGFDLTKHKTGK